MQRHFISRTSYLFNTTTTTTTNFSKSIQTLNFHHATPNTLTFLKKSRFHSGNNPIKPSAITNSRKTLPIKTISSIAAVSLAASYYYSSAAANADSDKVVEIASAPMSAFSNSTSAGTIAELMDDDNRAAMKAKSTPELLLGLFVYKLCTLPWIVDAAPHLIKLAETLHLQAPVYWFVKNTFFSQFCGGETAEECVATMTRLSQSGINCILDLSVEADLHMDELAHSKKEETGKYWRQEQKADVILEMIKNCLKTAATGQHEEYATSGAFAAVKVTAFAPPELLLRLNQVIMYLDQAFEMYQINGQVDTTCLNHVVNKICPTPQSELQHKQRSQILSHLQESQGTLDYIEFTKLFNLRGAGREVWWETDQGKTEKEVFLTCDDLQAYDRMVDRLEQVCQLAHDVRVGVMVDAEQSYFQEAIDHVAMNLQEKYNRRDDTDHSPTVYNTYQMYTKAAQKKLERDVDRANRNNFSFAAKLVRGAYMVSERKRADQMKYPSPIHETLEDTHESYNNGVRFLLKRLHHYQDSTGHALTATTAPIVFMVASHNRESTILTVEEMENHHVLPRSGVVHFGQLFGMQDQISYTLGKNGYSIYKYLPYGMIDEVIPYLLRRAQENSAVLGGVSKERSLMWQEVKDRFSDAAGVVHAPLENSSTIEYGLAVDVNSNGTTSEGTETA
ncbi:FAD-linked oxidoreductase-like protein [Helicostylum pulchrum]|nr:FAD-linked oxidoreductase-like protein [Helicostylum pulchrum]